MRRPAAWLLGGLAAAGLFRRRRKPVQGLESDSDPDPRAEELRRKLAESRAIVDERDDFEAAETTVDVVEAPGDPEVRRRAVHEAGRAAAERMRER
jgi:hypothetical protein